MSKKTVFKSASVGCSEQVGDHVGKQIAATEAIPKQPVDDVTWIHRDRLKANGYNPNNVFPIELDLLELSILESGWTQPAVVQRKTMQIVDGFHRWHISDRPAMLARFHGYIACVLVDLSEVAMREATVRHNRARGVHAVVGMGKLLADLVKLGQTKEQIARGLGMEMEEVERLLDVRGMPERAGDSDDFGRAWRPKRA